MSHTSFPVLLTISGGNNTNFRSISDPKMGRDIACLPDDKHPKEGQVCWAAGWGRDENGDVPKTLQEVDLEIISDATCKTTKNAPFIVEVSSNRNQRVLPIARKMVEP